MTHATIFAPDYELSLEGVRVDPDTEDWVAADLAAVMTSPIVSDAAVDLHARAGKPATLAYTADSVGLRVLTAAFRVAGVPASFIESALEPSKVKTAFDELTTGKVRVLAVRRPYGAGPAISGVALLLCRPTRCATSFLAFMARLSGDDDAVVIDLVGNVDRLGVPPGWSVEKISVSSRIVVADPVIARLGTMNTTACQRWAEGDHDRLVMIAKAKGYKPGWIDHAQQGWADKQVRGRARHFAASEARHPP